MRTTRKARKAGYRSGAEERAAINLTSRGVPFEFEPAAGKVRYTVPERETSYTPDFVLGNGVIIEVKGFFSPKDRKKHLLIQKQHPELDIRFVFTRPGEKLSKKSKTTYATWCKKNNFMYATKLVPESWAI